MVVDLLRPGGMPGISTDKMLWFEFLLNQKLLQEHLQNPNPEPSATDLIAEFLTVDVSNGIQDGPNASEHTSMSKLHSQPNISRKQLALKILALKIASALKWKLDTFETKLTPSIQQKLLQDLVFMASDGKFPVPPQEISMDIIQKPQMQFALTLHHRWILRYPVKATSKEKFAKPPFSCIPNTPLQIGYPQTKEVKSLRISENDCIQSRKYLEKVIAYYDSQGNSNKALQIRVPVMDTFTHPTEDMHNMAHNWDIGVCITQYELLMQIHFDLCYNYFFYGQLEEAKKHILGCRKNQKLLEFEIKSKGYGNGEYDTISWGNLNYASLSEDEIIGYIRALNLGQDLLDEERSLLQRLQESISNDYKDIIAIFQADNLSRDIPMIHRQVVELDIQAAALISAISVPKDLLIRVTALNAVRYALDGGLPSTQPDFLNKFNTIGEQFFDILFWALTPVLVSRLSEEDLNRLRIFFLHLTTSYQCRLPIDRIDEYLEKYVGDRALEIRSKLISEKQLEVLRRDQINSDDKNMDIPSELLTNNWDVADLVYNAPVLDIGRLKKRLLEVSSTEDVRMSLVKLATLSPSLPLWKHNLYCKPIGNLKVPLKALPRGFLQDFIGVMSGAARARWEAGDARTALSLLSVVESETRNQLAAGNDPALFKLCREIAWEMLLLEVEVMLSEWPHHRVNSTLLTNECKAAISAAERDVDAPSSQVVLAAWLGVLNMGVWQQVTGPGASQRAGGTNAADVAAALCIACAELQRGKGARKLPRRLWDFVLNTFDNSISQRKRFTYTSRHIPNYANRFQNLSPYQVVAQGLRDPLAISVFLSLLAKIYNVLVDDPSSELLVEYTDLWPNHIANINSYNPKDVLESLIELLERSLKFYPYNTSWLRLYGDAEIAASRHAAALRHYLCALTAGSEYFSSKARNEDDIVKRAAGCCQVLAAPTQAAALCQLPREIDYTRAFKCITEKITNVSDSMDAYYGCLWDGTLLEVAIATHTRRGEAGRRARAITAIGSLELNANNSEEIQREAAGVRRARLLRALTDQYVC
ncbi:integrator complex subunit 8-like [Leguminivora glycinivorella]|uniref:integrator complex subunit 8-like n=1 Tax=Leguminivora glycinivorella TaxID=1035111 RepID=UPI00200ED67F|nr:integrator complex subunit 8-like [Leguminivora glycinivorella]